LHGIQPIVVKVAVEGRDRSLVYEKWNSFSRVTVRSGAPGELQRPALWGPSPKLPSDMKIEAKFATIDGAAGTQMVRFDGDAATGAGAFTLTENGLYTVEAWSRFRSRLTERGLFTVSRWYSPGSVNETGRMVSLAVAMLIESGVSHPEEHIFLAASGQVATLIVSRSPLSAGDVATLEKTCDRYGYKILLTPGGEAISEVLARIRNS